MTISVWSLRTWQHLCRSCNVLVKLYINKSLTDVSGFSSVLSELISSNNLLSGCLFPTKHVPLGTSIMSCEGSCLLIQKLPVGAW